MKGFISYTHSDHALFRKLEPHLALGKDHGGADFWADNRLSAGEHWSPAIETAIDAAEIFLLLVSAKFFASAYIWHVELPRIVVKAAQCDGLIVPVILRGCRWEFNLGMYQAVPTIAGHIRPIADLYPHDRRCDLAARQVHDAIVARTARLAGTTPAVKTP